MVLREASSMWWYRSGIGKLENKYISVRFFHVT